MTQAMTINRRELRALDTNVRVGDWRVSLDGARIISDTRTEWVIADTACSGAEAVKMGANAALIVAMRNNWTALLDRIEELEGEKADLRSEARRILVADDEAPTKHGGLADCVDNDGAPYQSQALANCLARLRAALNQEPE